MATSFDQIFAGAHGQDRRQSPPSYSSIYPSPTNRRASVPVQQRRKSPIQNPFASPLDDQHPEINHSEKATAITVNSRSPSRVAPPIPPRRKPVKSEIEPKTRHRPAQPFVAWDGEDPDRLPEGFKRVAYDADTGTYFFRDSDGKMWQSKPGHEYGILVPYSDKPLAARQLPSGTANLKRSKTVSNPDPKHTFDRILSDGKGRRRGFSLFK